MFEEIIDETRSKKHSKESLIKGMAPEMKCIYIGIYCILV